MRWLITGGCGFIGTSLIKNLLENGCPVDIRILDNLSVGTESDLAEVCSFKPVSVPSEPPKGMELLIGDIKDLELVKSALKGVDCIVHLAANTGVGPSVDNPLADFQNNTIGTFNLLEAGREIGINKFIFASSGAPLGEVEEPPIHEELAPHPVSPYGSSKLCGESYCSSYYRTYGIETIVLRFGNVYGPRSKKKSSVVAKFIKKALNAEVCEIYGDGNQTRDFIYIDDLIVAIIKAANSAVGGEILQIASNLESTVNEVANSIKSILAEKSDIDMKIIYGDSRKGDVLRNYSDISKAKRLINWSPQYDLSEGLSLTIDYFMSLHD